MEEKQGEKEIVDKIQEIERLLNNQNDNFEISLKCKKCDSVLSIDETFSKHKVITTKNIQPFKQIVKKNLFNYNSR